MSNAERAYLLMASEQLPIDGHQLFKSDMVELAFPAQIGGEKMVEGYMRREPMMTSEQQFHNCINYGVNVYRIYLREADYEVHRIK